METPSIGPYPFREGLWRIYLWTLAHFPTHLCSLLTISSENSFRVKYSKLMSVGPWIPEESPASANIGWPMSYKGFFPLGGPSIMRVMADHYVLAQASWEPSTSVTSMPFWGCVHRNASLQVNFEPEMTPVLILSMHVTLSPTWAWT